MVKYARNRETKKPFAIKIYDKSKLVDQQKARNVRREISILSNLTHANIIKIYKVIETSDSVRNFFNNAIYNIFLIYTCIYYILD